jgi:hypothetical protein
MASYWEVTASGPPAGGLLDDTSYADYRCFVWGTGASLLQRVAPTAGGTIDGVSYGHGNDSQTGQHRGGGRIACPHVPVRVEASAAFAVGAQLETLADGRVKAVATGTPVLKALEAAAGAGSIVWAVFL